MEDKRILALIPARGGSTGIPGKNVKEFCGKPLIAYTIEAATESGVFDRIVVSTDSEEIAEVAKRFGAEVPLLRPGELAGSDSNIVDAVLHMLDHLKGGGYEPDLLMLLQPTSPLRDAGDITRSLARFRESGAPALVSVVKTHHQTLNIVDDRLVVLNGGATGHVNRQELPDTYKQDGSMIYIIDVPFLRAHRTFVPEGQTAPYVIPKWKAVDIDDPEDFELAEVLYKNRSSLRPSL